MKKMILKYLFCIVFLIIVFTGCGNNETRGNAENASAESGVSDDLSDDFWHYMNTGGGKMEYSSNSDSALYYYALGWHQIMDEGRYGQAEVSYRKVLEFDPDFLIGQAVLGRLTLDDEERADIYRNVESKRGSLPHDEEELLGVYHDFVQYTNRRESGDPTARAFITEALQGGEEIFKKTIQKYPEEPWMKSEYVEFVNSNKGGEAALDSLAVLTRNRHSENPFLLGFQASLEAELGNFEKALEIAKKLEAKTIDKTEPKPWAVYADVYFQMDSLKEAKVYADLAVELDPRNLDASRLQTKINAALNVDE